MYKDKYKNIQSILLLTLLLNWAVALTKFIYGLMTRSASMVADGVHSFGDGASNIIGLVGIWAASKPKDKDHPYGHAKYETMATLGIAVILFMAVFDIIKDAFFRLFRPVSPEVTVFSFVVILGTIVINIFVMHYENKKGRELSSDILICDSLHTKTDILSSLAVLVALLSIKLGFPYLDTIVAILIAFFIAKSGFEIVRDSTDVLCDANVLVHSDVSNIVSKVEGVTSVHSIRTRGRRDDIHVDLHIEIDRKMHVDDAHKLSHKIESLLKKNIDGVTDVIIHIEPTK